MEPLFFFGFLGFLAWRLWGKRYAQLSRASSALGAVPHFTPEHFQIGVGGTAIAVDSRTKQVAFVSPAGAVSVYRFRDIIGVELSQEGQSVSETNRRSQIFWGVLGYLLFNREGAIIGGTTGSTRTSAHIRALSLKVYVRDVYNPVQEIRFYDGRPKRATGMRIQRSAQALQEWHGRIQYAIASP